jgi:hypothetical protein
MADIEKINSILRAVSAADGYEILHQSQVYFLRKVDDVFDYETPTGNDSNNSLYFYLPDETTITFTEGNLSNAELSLDLINTVDSGNNSTQIFLRIIEPLLFTQPDAFTTCSCYRTRMEQSE